NTGIIPVVKRAIILFITSSLLLTSCIGNASLWGQYQTPTPVGGFSDPASPIPQKIPTDIPTLISTSTLEISPTETPTPALLNIFVKQNSTPSTDDPLTPTVTDDTVLYYAQSGDWLPAVANRFGVSASEVTSPKPLSDKGFIDPGTLLIIPDRLDKNVPQTTSLQIIPDSEVV